MIVTARPHEILHNLTFCDLINTMSLLEIHGINKYELFKLIESDLRKYAFACYYFYHYKDWEMYTLLQGLRVIDKYGFIPMVDSVASINYEPVDFKVMMECVPFRFKDEHDMEMNHLRAFLKFDPVAACLDDGKVFKILNKKLLIMASMMMDK